MLLLFIGVIIGYTAGMQYGAWPCGAGILLCLVSYLYKAFHWAEYAHDNKRNMYIVIIAIIIILFQMILLK